MVADEKSALEHGLRSAFVDSAGPFEEGYAPKIIANNKSTGVDLLSVIRTQLSACDSFDFCVAFIGDSGLQPLVDVFADLRRRGIRGRLLTSTYLNFNSPSMFRKLLEYDNIEVRVYQGNLHAKGYVFDRDQTSTVVVGSSNLTQMALTCNKEWNVLFRSFNAGGLLNSIRSEFDGLWDSAQTIVLNGGWIDDYEEYRKAQAPRPKTKAAFARADAVTVRGTVTSLKPNKMQELALAALAKLHARKEPRALLVSATGTGKTYLSAFDVAATKPNRVLFLVHRQRILDASMTSYQKLLGPKYSYGIYRPGSVGPRPTCMFAMCTLMPLTLPNSTTSSLMRHTEWARPAIRRSSATLRPSFI